VALFHVSWVCLWGGEEGVDRLGTLEETGNGDRFHGVDVFLSCAFELIVRFAFRLIASLAFELIEKLGAS
jgi:hypothetical protein